MSALMHALYSSYLHYYNIFKSPLAYLWHRRWWFIHFRVNLADEVEKEFLCIVLSKAHELSGSGTEPPLETSHGFIVDGMNRRGPFMS